MTVPGVMISAWPVIPVVSGNDKIPIVDISVPTGGPGGTDSVMTPDMLATSVPFTARYVPGSTASNNLAAGLSTQGALTSGDSNNAFGIGVQSLLTTGSSNNAFGKSAQYAPAGILANATTTASRQSSFGEGTGQSSAAQSDDITTIGYFAVGGGVGATSLGSGANAAFAGSVALGMSTITTAVNQVGFGSRHLELGAATASAPAAGAARLYTDGTRTHVRYSTGAATTIDNVDPTVMGTPATFGTDVVTNGSFTGSAAPWTLGLGATWASDIVTTVTGSTVEQTVTVASNTLYLLSWQGSVYAGGTWTIQLDTVTVVVPSQARSVGIRANTSGAVVLRFTVVGAAGTFDNVTCVPVVISNPGAMISGTEVRYSGSQSTGFGRGVQANVTVNGGYNSAFGAGSQGSVINGGANSAFGYLSQSTLSTGSYNSAFGYNAQASLTNGVFNSGFGNNAQLSLTTGSSNTAVGNNAQYNLTTGDSNTSVGERALGQGANATTTASRQTALGVNAGQSSSAQSNDITTIGYGATAAGLGATALGSGSSAAFSGSVALGMGTITTLADQVSFGARHLEMKVIGPAPVAGAASSARLFLTIIGGKTALSVQFPTGSPFQIAIEV